MCLAVADPRLLVEAFRRPSSCRMAKLLSLFLYGRVCLNAHGITLDESAELEELARNTGATDSARLASVWARANQDHEEAAKRRTRMDEAFEEHPPSDLLLVTSPLFSLSYTSLQNRVG